METAKLLSLVFALYATGFIFTFGLFYRDQQVSVGPKQIIAAAVWPVWWVLANGIGGVIDAIDSVGTATEARKCVSFASGLLAASACLLNNWGDCTGAVTCTAVAGKSVAMFFPPLSFIYLGWSALHLL